MVEEPPDEDNDDESKETESPRPEPPPQYVDPSIESAREAHAADTYLDDVRGCLSVLGHIIHGVVRVGVGILHVIRAIAELFANFFGHW